MQSYAQPEQPHSPLSPANLGANPLHREKSNRHGDISLTASALATSPAQLQKVATLLATYIFAQTEGYYTYIDQVRDPIVANTNTIDMGVDSKSNHSCHHCHDEQCLLPCVPPSLYPMLASAAEMATNPAAPENTCHSPPYVSTSTEKTTCFLISLTLLFLPSPLSSYLTSLPLEDSAMRNLSYSPHASASPSLPLGRMESVQAALPMCPMVLELAPLPHEKCEHCWQVAHKPFLSNTISRIVHDLAGSGVTIKPNDNQQAPVYDDAQSRKILLDPAQ